MAKAGTKWVRIAETRTITILKARIAANIRQLEAKICESGPPGLRPDPHNLTIALKNLEARGLLAIIKPPGEKSRDESKFFTLREYYPDPARQRVDELLIHLRVHRLLTDKEEYCSRVLEDIVAASFQQVPAYTDLGKLPPKSPLDGVYRVGEITLGVEVKNVREWVYPMSGRIWVMIRKCLEIDAVPLLITRKIAFITHLGFIHIGVTGYEYHRQVFAKKAEHYLEYVQHKDALGYKDVIATSPDPNPLLVDFLKRLLPLLPSRASAWGEHRDVLEEFAVSRDLGNPARNDDWRQKHYRDFVNSVLHPEEEDDETTFGDEDEYE